MWILLWEYKPSWKILLQRNFSKACQQTASSSLCGSLMMWCHSLRFFYSRRTDIITSPYVNRSTWPVESFYNCWIVTSPVLQCLEDICTNWHVISVKTKALYSYSARNSTHTLTRISWGKLFRRTFHDNIGGK